MSARVDRSVVLCLASPVQEVAACALHACLSAPYEEIQPHEALLKKIVRDENECHLTTVHFAAAALLLLNAEVMSDVVREAWCTSVVEPEALCMESWDSEVLAHACAVLPNLPFQTQWSLRTFFTGLANDPGCNASVQAAARDVVREVYAPTGSFGLAKGNNALRTSPRSERIALCDDSKHAALVTLLAEASNRCAERMRRRPPPHLRRIDWGSEVCRLEDESLLEEEEGGNDAEGNAPARKVDEELLHACGFNIKQRPSKLTEIPSHVLYFQPLKEPAYRKPAPPEVPTNRKPAPPSVDSVGRKPPPIEQERAGKNMHPARAERHRGARLSGGGGGTVRAVALAF